ncbi:hypothetical protein N4T77_02230 [Clostridium sp. CX1]|uniref:Uncharacterized protein n=1 Tax=Clostridium tanneri TaxID=3037988 RepID=A0ABU4JT79_9CLOT|nr:MULTISPECIES: hypothetical protein [unclassified Clostridium]MCT8975407.1 hypothetical protein [Clostridium sp. CX1]MDW8801362.1 hypothetical protein [Clostridium sp. A1-XYC3]
MNEKKKQISFNDISKSYLVESGEEVEKSFIKSSDIIEDKDGNCTVLGEKIEANACSMLKEDYKL